MKITIIGAAGAIGQVLSLMLKNQLSSGSELFLHDVSQLVKGVAIDISHIPTDVLVTSSSGENIDSAISNADIIIIAAGKARKPGMNRSDLLNFNVSIIFDIAKQIANINPKAFIGVITNPLNTTVAVVAETLKKYGVYDRKLLFGITTLDIIRANAFISDYGVATENCNVIVVGGHSNTTILPLLSQVNGLNLSDYEVTKFTDRLRFAGDEVVKFKNGNGSATLSMGLAATRFTLSLVQALQGNNVVECAYTESDDYASFFSRPLVINKKGIKEYQKIGKISLFEFDQIKKISDFLRQDIQIGIDFVSKMM